MGFIWFGTDNGLNRYDGNKFVVYRHSSTESSSLSGNFILSLAEDKRGNIWVGTRRDGISVYNRDSGTFKRYKHQAGNSKSLPENDVFGFYISNKGDVWVKTESFLSKYDHETDGFESFGHFSNLFKRTTSLTYPVVYETDSTLLVGTKDGINRFNIKRGVFERLNYNVSSSGVSNEMVSDIVQISNNLYLLATHSGLQLCETVVGTLPIVAKNALETESAVNVLFSGNNEIVWVGTKKGLGIFNIDSFVHRIVEGPKKNKQSIVPHEITSIIEDASGLIWVGTKFYGVFKLSTLPPKFFSIEESNFSEWPLRSFNIQSVVVESNKEIWAGTLSSGVYSINRATGKLRNFVVNNDRYKNFDDAVYSMFKDEDGKLWLGTNSGIYILNKLSGLVEEFNYGSDAKYATLLKNNQINTVVKDKNGGVWFGTQFGLYRYRHGRIVGFFKADEKYLPSDEIAVILPDENDRLWIGTSGGLCYYDLLTGLFMPVKIELESNENCQPVLSLATQGHNKVWIGTRAGLFVLQENATGVFAKRAIDELKNEMINTIIIDHAQKVWISSSKGISVLSYDETLQAFDEQDGLSSHIFNQRCGFKSESGELFFGNVSGLFWVHPDSIILNMHQPKVAITHISVCHRGDCEEVFVPDSGELQIKYKPGMMIEFEFSALEFLNPQENHYKIMLEGYDEKWRKVTKNQSVSFSDLRPGAYTLKIFASNSNLIWNDKPLEFPFYLKPPLWMTPIAYAFYLFVIIFIIQLVVNYRVRHYRKANRSLTEKSFDKKRIEAQRSVLSRINQNLTDSITYATRIQSAMIPTENRLREILPNSFVYFRPRDMVSGDFYYLYSSGNKTFLAVVDCTGHGVPGAFMSIIGMDLLKSIIEGHKEDDPARILELMNTQLAETFTTNTSQLEEGDSILRDGMDMGLCVIDHENGVLNFAGAVNELYVIRNNEINSYKGSRSPLGRFSDGNTAPNYNTIQILIQPDDMVYLFSDGYVDQFGGPDLKKFKYRRFRHLLLNIHNLQAEDQKAILHQKLEDWKGSLEQVDDIVIMGFSPFKLA